MASWLTIPIAVVAVIPTVSIVTIAVAVVSSIAVVVAVTVSIVVAVIGPPTGSILEVDVDAAAPEPDAYTSAVVAIIAVIGAGRLRERDGRNDECGQSRRPNARLTHVHIELLAVQSLGADLALSSE